MSDHDASLRAQTMHPVLIGIPFYRSERLVFPVVQSLIRCADEIREIGGELILFNDSPGYEPLASALEAVLPEARAAFPVRVVENADNLGFVRTMNRLIAEGVARRFDVLMMNSDTVVFPGALREMVRVAGSDPMIGFVNPRSNNATLATLPFQDRFRHLQPEAAHAAWAAVAGHLPDVSYAPTAVGFCLLCRWKILAEFGGLDEIYGDGYHEENDLVMRANRCGYRAVLANKAFVWHAGEASFGLSDRSKSLREAENQEILFARYPEYEGLVKAHFQTPEHHAEQLLGALIPDADGKIDVAFDFSSFGGYHNGTFVAGRQLLAAAAVRWRARFNLFVICSAGAYRFHDYGALGVERRDPNGADRYAAIFRVGQPYDVGSLNLLVMRAAVIGLYMLDTISIDCGQLYSPRLYNVWQFALDHADLIVTTSQLTTDQLARRFHHRDDAVRIRSMHSLDLEDYRPPTRTEGTEGAQGALSWLNAIGKPYLLVVGNKFPHKYVIETTNALAEAFPECAIVALGVTKSQGDADVCDDGRWDRRVRNRLSDAPNIVVSPVGDLTQADMAELYRAARAVVFPTHYEGFGFPILDALAVETPIFARRNQALEEVWLLQGANPNVHFFDLTSELIKLLPGRVAWRDAPDVAAPGGGAARSADEILRGLDKALEQVSYRRITDRIRSIQFIDDMVDFETSKRVKTTVMEARGLSRRLSAKQAELVSLQDRVHAFEKSFGGRMLGWVRRRLEAHPRVRRLVDRLTSRLTRMLRPSPVIEPAGDPSADFIARSGLFDAAWYLKTYKDVADGGVDPLFHFMHQALAERRDPGPDFSTEAYLERHPEVFETGLNPLEHYLTVGRSGEDPKDVR